MLIEVDIGHRITDTIRISIWEQYLMLKGDMDIVPIPYTIPPITKVNVVDS